MVGGGGPGLRRFGWRGVGVGGGWRDRDAASRWGRGG